MDLVDVTVQVGGLTAAAERQELEERLRALPGVLAPRFNREHELVVAYDPAATGSGAILAAVRERAPQAHLVGL